MFLLNLLGMGYLFEYIFSLCLTLYFYSISLLINWLFLCLSCRFGLSIIFYHHSRSFYLYFFCFCTKKCYYLLLNHSFYVKYSFASIYVIPNQKFHEHYEKTLTKKQIYSFILISFFCFTANYYALACISISTLIWN